MTSRYADPKLRERLAAAYALGTLQGRARTRFQSLLRYDQSLQREVAQWQERLQPLMTSLPDRVPPARVWQAIGSRLGHADARANVPGATSTAQRATPSDPVLARAAGANRWWESVGWWRGLAVAMAISTIALGMLLNSAAPPVPAVVATGSATQSAGMMAILTDAAAQPTMLVSWPMQARADGKVELRVRIIMDHPTMDPNTSWQLWLMPRDTDGQAQSVGLVGIEPEQRLTVDASMLKALIDASGMALSNEPAGGSPTGVPTGPVIFRGPSIRI